MASTLQCGSLRDLRLVHMIAGLAFLLALLPQMAPLLAQGLDSEEAIESIIGSDVSTEEQETRADPERVIAAISGALDAAGDVRKAFSLDELSIVFLPDFDEQEARVEEAIAANDESITALRQAIEGNAMFYHATNSRGVVLSDIVALEFGEENTATVFVAGNDPNE